MVFKMTHNTIRVLRCRVRKQISAVAFWSAIALPFLYLPVLFTGLETQSEIGAFVIMLAINVVAIVAGQYHER